MNNLISTTEKIRAKLYPRHGILYSVVVMCNRTLLKSLESSEDCKALMSWERPRETYDPDCFMVNGIRFIATPGPVRITNVLVNGYVDNDALAVFNCEFE